MDYLIICVLLLCSIVPLTLGQLFGGSCDDMNSCARHGVCVDGPVENTFWCSCSEGYGGDFCEQKCDLNCGEGQKCSRDRKGQMMCVCQGNNCLEPKNIMSNTTDPCATKPCNNGSCISFNDGYQCICHNGYGGSYCEKGRNNCLGNKCSENSQCVNTPDGYYCACHYGRTGQFCEKIDCEQTPGICNRGSCVQSLDSDKTFECVCDEGFEGELCNMDKNECLDENLCENEGVCINLPGSYRCDCKPGYTGRNCGDMFDGCENLGCENGAECVYTKKKEPVCMCPQGFVGQRCESQCPPGLTGPRCTLQKDRPTCSRDFGSCRNGGQCVKGFCVCPPDFLGNHCELKREEASLNTCASDPCMNNAACVNVTAEIGYVCFCPPGFDGDICERPSDVCNDRPCANGGKCSRRGRSFSCECPVGFQGKMCEQKTQFNCFTEPCQNEGTCRRKGSTTICTCPYGFTGPLCEKRIHLTEPKESLIRKICENRKCATLAGNGICDEQCNQAACDFDGGDCSGGQQPFAMCKYGLKCADVFANGVCDQECNNEECLYDGMDCLSSVVRCPLKIRDHCIARFANRICDPECNSEGCGFDGGDCMNRTEAIILSDIRIKIQIDPSEFQRSGGETLMQIGAALRVTVRIQRDEIGPLVFEWNGEQELGRLDLDVNRLVEQKVLSSRIRRTRSSPLYELHGVVLYLEVEDVCQHNECRFTTAQSVVDMIAAGLTKTNGRMSLGLPITEAMVAAPRRVETEGWTRNQIFLLAAIVFLAFGAIVAGVIVKTNEPERSRKRKIVTAPVWMPPMDPATKDAFRNQFSSQRSLLENNEYMGAKRHCGEYGPEYTSQYQIYSHNLNPAYNTALAVAPPIPGMPQSQNIELPAVEIPLHVQAEGPDPISAGLITKESVNQADSTYKRCVLHWLAANNKGKPENIITYEAVQCMKAGANVNARDCDDNTPLMLAVKAQRGRLVLNLLYRGADPRIFNKSERNALHEAAANKGHRIMEILLTDKRLLSEIDELERNGMTALMLVARCEGDLQVPMAELLLKNGAKVDADGASRKDSEIYRGRTALHYAALADNLPMAQFLVSRNAYKDKQDEAGKTPLMLAAKEGHERTVRYLISAGACLTIVDVMDKTAAQLARENYHYEIADILQKVLIEKTREESDRRNAASAFNHTNAGAKNGRQTFKAVKRTGSRKTPAPSTSSRESNHLTPPQSDGSFSSPSPMYFHTTASTPTAMESSPEYGYQHPDMKTKSMWYSGQSPYDPSFQQMPPNQAYTPSDQNNSFYC